MHLFTPFSFSHVSSLPDRVHQHSVNRKHDLAKCHHIKVFIYVVSHSSERVRLISKHAGKSVRKHVLQTCNDMH